jgi:hypothetical protein
VHDSSIDFRKCKYSIVRKKSCDTEYLRQGHGGAISADFADKTRGGYPPTTAIPQNISLSYLGISQVLTVHSPTFYYGKGDVAYLYLKIRR